ncbi:M16 family metallopeptidase [Chromobacterium phragmitis]|uniref:Insulinase family protein n=1 Tax=Chromobacterium phragmitis TaxID=2202141 RepID=A0A344UJR4_9NEIS|nr:pitrilysin family protein [Chromobacterium phragmitis]AXE35512.1 insulinase family protein [Chromobacterium phragmitis]
MTRLKTLSLLLTLALAPSLPALATPTPTAVQAPRAAAPYASVEGISEYRLANGLRVLLAPDASKPTATVNLTYLVGSRHEGYGETGMAHLLEHMLFKGTPRSGNLMTELSRRGMQFNGTTYFDRTNYYESFPAGDANLDWALAMEADRMVNSKIAKSDLDTEFSVVRNEMERGENSPASALTQQLAAISFDWHNYGHDTIGARSDVEKVRIENLRAFYRKYYQPDNAVLVIAGKFEPAAALAMVQRHFGKIPRPARALAPTWTEEPVRDGEREVTVRRVGDVSLAALLYRTAPASHPDSAAIEALALILGDTPNGRLHAALSQKGLAVNIGAMPYSLAEGGYIIFYAELGKNQTLAKLRPDFQAAIEDIRSQPITEAELKRAKTILLNQFDQTLRNPQGLAIHLSEAIAAGDWRLFFLQRDRIEALTVADAQRAAENYFKRDNRSFGQFIPAAQPDRASIPAAPDVAKLVDGYRGKPALEQGEAFDPTPSHIDARTERAKLSNGAELALLAKKTRGATVSGNWFFGFGDEDSLRGRHAAAGISAAMLARGSQSLDRAAIADKLDALQAGISIGLSGQGVAVRFKTTREHLPQLIDLIAELLQRPAFPAGELAQLKQQAQVGIDGSRHEPGALAEQALDQKLNAYAQDDFRYRPTLDESQAIMNALSLDDLRRFHQQFYGASHARLALVGDFDAAAVKTQLEQRFGGWTSPAPYRQLDPLRPSVQPDAITLRTPDKANAVYAATMPLALRDDAPDYVPLMLGNYILGGGPESRLVKRLRQRDGISYGAGSGVSASSRVESGWWNLEASYAPENLARLKQGVGEELSRLLRDGVSEQELANAKRALSQTLKLMLAEDDSLASLLEEHMEQRRNMAYIQSRLEQLEKLTVADVNAALRKHLKPEQLTQVYAGDFSAKPAAGK